MKENFRSLSDLRKHKETVEGCLLSLLFTNSEEDLLKYLETITPLCHHSWIKAQQLISIAAPLPYHKSYCSLLKYFYNFNILFNHFNFCDCMTLNLNKFNNFGITPFLKSLPCSYDLLQYQVSLGANVLLTPRYYFFGIGSPLFVYMKHLVDQIYDQKMDVIMVDQCITYLCSLGVDPNEISSNILVLFSISADILVQGDFENMNIKVTLLEYLDRVLKSLLEGNLNPSKRNNNNKLSYELHGDGLFDFVFMLRHPNDEYSLEHICKWIALLIKYGCDPEIEMKSKCRELLKFKLISEKPNNVLSIFYYIIHELFNDDFVNSSSIKRLNYIIRSLTSQRMQNLTIAFFKKNQINSPFLSYLDLQPQSLKSLTRYIVVSRVLNHRLVNIDSYNLPVNVIYFVKNME